MTNDVTLRPEQLRDHAIRTSKYEEANVARNLGVTGDSEQKTRYRWSDESDKIATGKTRVTRKDFDINPYFNQYPPYFEGRTEYAQRYVRHETPETTNEAHSRHDNNLKTTLVINPRIELENATQGRPMATSAQTELAHTVYRDTYSWPQSEPRKERYEWLNR